MNQPSPRQHKKNILEQVLGVFAEVKAGEGVAVVMMFVNIFAILLAYYVLKVVRDGLIVGGVELFGLKGSEIKAYLPAVMALLLVGVVPGYGALASRFSRIKLLAFTTSFVVGSLLVFFAWGRLGGIGNAIGLAFYVWLGVVNYLLVAQFWSFANDIYTQSQGKRLFAIIGIGQSLGAIFGPGVARVGKDVIFLMMAASAVVFGVCFLLYLAVNRMDTKAPAKDELDEKTITKDEPLSKDGSFQLVFRTRYLLLIASMVLVSNVVNTTGEYVLSDAASGAAEKAKPAALVLGAAAAAKLADAKTPPAERKRLKKELKKARTPLVVGFYGGFFFWVNLVGLLVQMLLVSRIFKYFGVRAALFVLPLIAFGGYAAIGLIGGLLVLRIAKTAENAMDYSLQNTVKQALFLPTSREAKYKAKAAIDTFFVRFGDAASAGIVAVGLNVLSFNGKAFALVNVGLVGLLWLPLALAIAREHKRLAPAE